VLDDAAQSVRSSITGLRSTLVDIYPPDLAESGLWAALGNLAADASNDDLTVSLGSDQLPDHLAGPVAELLYRSAREALRNVTLHAGASEATVRAGGNRDRVWVEVADNGSGFDPAILEVRAAEGHLGLKGLQGVLNDAGGALRLDSVPGRGTTLRVEVPAR
jgi:signal transduction histidine kinase